MADADSTVQRLFCAGCGDVVPFPKNWKRISIWRRLKPRRCKWCIAKVTKKHGLSQTRLYKLWLSMLTRCGYRKCSNPSAVKYYINKGVTVCDDWMEFPTFAAWAFANGYADHLTIDRKDSMRGYSPENCRWVTMTENLRSRSDRVLNMEKAEQIRALKTQGKTGPELAAQFGCRKGHIYNVWAGRAWRRDA